MEGQGTLSVHVFTSGQRVIIDISDTGKGIEHSMFNAIFDPGYTTKARGWGLGLSLSKRIIEDYHKGKIFVKRSTLGEGTTFRIRLPKATAPLS
jgi:signal transduction histidine kinase